MKKEIRIKFDAYNHQKFAVVELDLNGHTIISCDESLPHAIKLAKDYYKEEGVWSIVQASSDEDIIKNVEKLRNDLMDIDYIYDTITNV